METMKSRAALLNAEFAIVSEVGKGTRLSLIYPYKNARSSSSS
jgi:signal transduction histidine kinase